MSINTRWVKTLKETVLIWCVVYTGQIKAKKSKEKRVYLEGFLDDFELVKLELRICFDMKLLSVQKHAAISELMERIGKQITAWRNAQVV